MSFLSLRPFVEDQEPNSLCLDMSEYLSSMYARSIEGNNVDGRFILVKVKVGKVIPIRKPTITPKKDVNRSLII